MTTYVERRLKRRFEEKYDFGWAGEHDDIQIELMVYAMYCSLPQLK